MRNKIRACEEVGIDTELIKLRSNVSEKRLLKLIDKANKDKKVNGVFVQFPLPNHLDEKVITNRIDPSKDVDGLHDINLGKILQNDKTAFVPCTVSGVLQLLDSLKINVEGKNICIAGRSNIVGKPLALALINRGATVTSCNSKTKDIKKHIKASDIFVSAIGSPKYFDKTYFNKDHVVIDVGINRVDGKVCGDVDYNSVVSKVKYITPVPGGVGLLTTTNVLLNVIKAYKLQNKLN